MATSKAELEEPPDPAEDLFEDDSLVKTKVDSCDCCGMVPCGFQCIYCRAHCVYTGNGWEDHYYCNTCKTCTSKEDFKGFAPGVCDTCHNCFHGCCCWNCGNCEKKFAPGESGCASCETCSNCGCSCPKHQSGQSDLPPWEQRGTTVTIDQDRTRGRSWTDEWPFAPNLHDPVQAAAEFYLLEAVENAIGPGWTEVGEDNSIKLLREQARAIRAELVELWDHNFRMYVAMACWGESRYHQCLGWGRNIKKKTPKSVFTEPDGDRTSAWTTAKQIEEQVGVPQVYYDLYELFSEMDGKSVGGKRWATAIRLVADRCADILTPAIFVDRVFSMQHNGGSLLNKVRWGCKNPQRWGVQAIKDYIGPAHSENPTDWETLCKVARPEVVDLFGRYVEQSDRIRKAKGHPPLIEKQKAWRDFWGTVPAYIRELAKRDSGAALDEFWNWYDWTQAEKEKEPTLPPKGSCECDTCMPGVEECGGCDHKICICDDDD